VAGRFAALQQDTRAGNLRCVDRVVNQAGGIVLGAPSGGESLAVRRFFISLWASASLVYGALMRDSLDDFKNARGCVVVVAAICRQPRIQFSTFAAMM
jgi:hypothetical protein